MCGSLNFFLIVSFPLLFSFTRLFCHKIYNSIAINGAFRRYMHSKQVGLLLLMQRHQVSHNMTRRSGTIPFTRQHLVRQPGSTHVMQRIDRLFLARKIREPCQNCPDKLVPSRLLQRRAFPMPRFEMYPQGVSQHHLSRSQHTAPASIRCNTIRLYLWKVIPIGKPKHGRLVFFSGVVVVDRVERRTQHIHERNFLPLVVLH
mmetsp:Transcript_14174/g.26522  ORF Transcript_14174/g.26522 Transcript_14174/m.26522 type:complete len:202 (+) Transcript_14174:660-1265(+)